MRSLNIQGHRPTAVDAGECRYYAAVFFSALRALWVLAPFVAMTPAWSGQPDPPSAGGEWEGYNKSLDGQRFSPLVQIGVANASHLRENCRVRVADRGSFQSGLVMVGNT